jgi:acyl-CoA synthetase (AMP-forming)/AMP-acid ligase II
MSIAPKSGGNLEHPMVRDVAVIGVPTQIWRAGGRCHSVRDATLSDKLPGELRATLGRTLAQFKIPTAAG